MNIPKYIDKRSKEAYWVQLYHTFRSQIISGEIAAKSELPDPQTLAEQQGLTLIDVNKAYNRLMKEQLIERHGDHFLAYARAVDPLMFDRLTNLSNVIESRSKRASIRDLPIETVDYDPAILPKELAGRRFYRMRRIFLADQSPVFFLDSYFDVEIMPKLIEKTVEDTRLYTELYAENAVQNYRSERLIKTTQVPAEIAKILQVNPGRACIKTAITAYRGDQIFEYTLVWQLADEFIFEFRMDLKD